MSANARNQIRAGGHMSGVYRRVTDDGLLVPVEREEVWDSDARPGAQYWVDLTAPPPDELRAWFDALAVPDLVRGLAQESSTTRVFAVGNVVWFSAPVFANAGDASATPMSGLVGGGVLITFHEYPSEALETARRAAQADRLLNDPSASGVLAGLCKQAAYRTVIAGRGLRERVKVLGDRMEREPGAVGIDEILQAANAIDDLDAVVEDQLVWVRAMRALTAPPLDLQHSARELDLWIGNLVFLERTVDRLEKRVDTLRNRFDLLLSERTNRRLGFLTILSAIFLPLTLIAGIYGMNFDEMPELHIPFAYPIALACMAAIALGMVWFFWRRGWFE